MRVWLLMASFLMLCVSIEGCTNNQAAVPPEQAAYNSYSPATTNYSSMFRSPPPGAAAAVRAR